MANQGSSDCYYEASETLPIYYSCCSVYFVHSKYVIPSSLFAHQCMCWLILFVSDVCFFAIGRTRVRDRVHDTEEQYLSMEYYSRRRIPKIYSYPWLSMSKASVWTYVFKVFSFLLCRIRFNCLLSIVRVTLSDACFYLCRLNYLIHCSQHD
jgi:hypothetical protein